MAGIFTYNINIKDIESKAERETATKIATEIESPGVVSKRGELSGLIQELKGGSEQAKAAAEQLGPALFKAVMAGMKNIVPEINRALTTLSQRKERVTTPSQTRTAQGKSLIDSSDALMSQIQKDFITFKTKFAKTIKTQLVSAHGEAFKVVGRGRAPYARRGGVDVLKIADMNKLTTILKQLTGVEEKRLVALTKRGPSAMMSVASKEIMKEMSGEFGGTQRTRMSGSMKEIAQYVSKHGYEGLNKNIKKLVQTQTQKGEVVTPKQIEQTLTTKSGKLVESAVLKLLGQTAGRTRIQQYTGAAVSEVEVPRPQRGPQGLPAIRMQSGRHRALTPEYRFTPGMMVASRRAQQIIGAGGEEISRRRELVGKVRKTTPELPRMILKDQKAALGEHASNIMEVMKTDKKGRLELVNAYRETITSKTGKEQRKLIPKDKESQLRYLDELSTKAKKLSIGFDDVLVALGKFSKTGIYDRLLGSLTKETVGKTSPMRTTVQSLAEDTQAIKTFNKRIREPFTGQELVEEEKPMLGWYQSQTAKLNIPKLAKGRGGVVSGEEQREELVAHNRELEKFSNLKKKQLRLSSQGIGESRAVKMEPDVRDASRQMMNVFAGDIRSYMPFGELSNVARTIAPTYHALGGGRVIGGKAIEGLERPLLQSERGRAAEKAGVWGRGGYGLNLQTVLADSANTFEDQIDITGKAVNRFAKYIKPMIKDVSGAGGAELVSKDIVSQFAPEVGKTLRMKGAEGEGVSKTLVGDVSKVLTGAGGENLEAVAVKVVERLFTALGTKMTTAAGSKGVVTFKKGEEGELGYTERPAFTHELLTGMLEKKRKGLEGVKGKGAEKARGEIDKSITDLEKAGTVPFVSFMHKDLPKKVQNKYKQIRDSIQKILDIDLTVSPETIANIRTVAKKQLGAKAMTKSVATEVRMSLTGATKRLNLMEPMEAVVNNIAGNVEAIAPKLTPKQLAPTGEVSQYLQAMGHGWGPEEKLPMEKRTLPMYTGEGGAGVIAGQKFWRYPREPGRYEEWSGREIETGRKGQKLNVAAMSALMSTFGEKSAVAQEAMAGYKPRTGQALENIMALRTLGEEPVTTKAPYIPTTGMRELPSVISKHEDLRDTILDVEKFGAGGFAEIPEFEKGKEVGKRPLYIPSKESLGMYAEAGGGAGANKLAVMYNSLLTNVEEYGKIQKREYPRGEKADVGIVRKNVKTQIGKTSSTFRKMLDTVTAGERSALSGGDLKNLINYFKQVENIIKSAVASGDVGVGAMATTPGKLLSAIGDQVTVLGGAAKGKGVGKGQAFATKKLLRTIKDSLLEPKPDVEGIKRTEADLGKLRTGKPLTDLSSKAYYFHKKGVETWKKKDFTTEQFEADTPDVREWVKNSLKRYLGTLTAGKGKPGLLSVSEGAVGVAAKQFGVTTDVKEQALEERRKAIERDKTRLKKELVTTTIGKGKGAEVLQTRTIPAISGTLTAAINTKVEDFKAAAEIIKNLGAKGILGDTSGLTDALATQTKKHEQAVKEEAAGGRVVLREGEVGLPAAKLEKLTGDYGEAGKTALEAVRSGKEVQAMTTRFPITGIASHQFAKLREITHPKGREVVALPGAAPGIDVPEIEKITGRLKERQAVLREERAALPEAKAGTAASKQLDAQRAALTKNINELSRAIDLVTVKFSGFAQNADVDGDTLMVHAGKTKAAQKEITDVARTRRTGVYGKVGTSDPRAFINKMMSYNVKAQTSSMAELADLYTSKAKLPVAKLFQTPEVTREMKGVSAAKVMEGLAAFKITPESITKIAKAKGLTEPEQVETVARETLYEKTRAQQYGKLYVKTGLGESTESISRVARLMEASVGFGGKQVTKPEYAAWKPESVALGAVYGKGGVLTQKARPGREMQTMMNVLLEQVINQAMSAKHGGKAAFQEVTQGVASGTLFKTMQEDVKLPKKDQRFRGILEANEIIKTVIRDRLDALNAVDFAAEAKRHKVSGKGRAAVTDELVNQFSFEGFLGATAKDIQGQILKTAKTPKQKFRVEQQIAKGELDLGMYFPQMQKGYSLRTSTASIEKFAAQVQKGKSTLDKAITKVMGIIKETGAGVSVSDVMMTGAFKNMFGMFQTAEKLGVNLGKVFEGAKTAKQKRRTVGGLERRLGMPVMTVAEQQMIKTEGAKLYKERRPEAGEEEIAKHQEEYLFQHRRKAIEKHVKAAKYKKELMFGVAPVVGEQYKRQVLEKERKIPPKGPLMLPRFGTPPRGMGYISEPDVPGIPEETVLRRDALVRRRGKAEVIAGAKPAEAKIGEAKAILKGGVKGIDYAAVGDIPAPELVTKLKEYTESLNLLVNGATGITTQQTAKIQQAVTFVKQNLGALAALPAGTKLGAAAKGAVSAYRTISQEDLLARGGISAGGLPPGKPPTGEPPERRPPEEEPKKPPTGKYKTELQALTGLVAAARQRTGYTPEGLPETVTGALESIRRKEIPPHVAPEFLRESMKDVPFTRQKTIWSQYHLEKVQAETDIAQKAEEAGDIVGREEALRRAKTKVVTSYGAKTTPFLTREEGGRGRISGYADEEAVAKLGIYRMPEERERVLQKIDIKSRTAGKAVAPVLMGTERMEQRLKTMWSRIREFNPELAKAGKAFDFTNAKKDLAIIKEELKSFRTHGMFGPEEYSDLEHAVRQVTKMEKAVQEAPEKGLPALAIPGLETRETAEAAYENLLAATEKEMLADKDLAVGAKRKVAFKIPTEEGLIERRETTLVARGAKEGVYAPGVVGGIERVKGKPTVEREEIISRRSIRLLKEFEGSTKSINEKIKQVWLGIKKFDKAAGSVDFNEALKDLSDMHMMLTEMLKVPGLPAAKHAEYSQLKRKMGTAIRTMAETPAEGMEGVIMKGMETPESAKVAFKKRIEAQKAALWEREELVPGQAITVAATLPTAAGVEQKRQVQLRAIGEEGVVTGIEERKVKTAKEYARELRSGKRTRGGTLVSEFMEGTGDVNKRISSMILGVKRFDEGLAKAGKHTKAINFDTAEKDLVHVIKLLDEALKGAVHLTEEERAAYKQAQLAAKAMYQKVVKTPLAGRKGISMAGYETPASSLAAHRAKIEEESKKLIEANVRGKSMVVTSRLMSEGGGEVPISKRLTARGGRFFGFGGRVSRVAEREEVGGGQVGSVIRRVALWGSASGLIYGILGGARQMLQTMKQAETGLVNLKKVMSHVTTDFDHMRDSAVRFAKDYGAELMSVLETMRIFAQQGLPQEQVKEMARVSTLAANVTTMKPTEAAEALTSATRQFNIEGEKSISILDSWNEVENRFAITAKDLADGFKKAGTAAKITGIDVNKLNGIITAIGEATRQTGKEVGTSLKFIFSRMATEKAPRALKAVGVETIEGGRLKEGSVILDDLAKRWVTLTRAQKLATAQSIGGIRHYNALMVMMDNYDRALAATAASINSVGSAEKENKMIMETYEKKTAQMKASFDALAVSASGPILTALKAFADSLKGVLEIMDAIPGAGLAAMGTLAYVGATGLGKYFDLSMFGLLGSSVGGAKRKRRGPMEMIRSAVSGKGGVGRDVLAARFGGVESVRERASRGSIWSRKDKAIRAMSRSGGVSLGPPVPITSMTAIAGSGINKKIEGITKSFRTIPGAVKAASFSVVGMLASFSPLAKVVVLIGLIAAGFAGFNWIMSKTFASAKERTKDYAESLEIVEERLKSIGSIKLLRTKLEIETERMKSLEAMTPEQRAAQVEGRSYKSPVLIRKKQVESMKEYASAVAVMTTESFVGFDKFGKAIISTTKKLDGTVDKLEEIANKAKLELKLYITGEELKDLIEAPEIDTWFKSIQYKFREMIGKLGEAWNSEFLQKYATGKRNPFENLLRSMEKIDDLRRKAGGRGETIKPPDIALKETDKEEYNRQKKRFEEWSKAQTEHLTASKTINEKFLEVRRDFFTLGGPGTTPEMAGKAAFGKTGRLLAEVEREKYSQFYEEQGATVADIQASFFQRLRGINVRATAAITREAAMEQGIPFRPARAEEGILEQVRAKDILMFKEGVGIQGEMASVFERGGKLFVQYAEEAADNTKEMPKAVEETLEKFSKMDGIAENFVGVMSSMGMLTPTAMRLRAISKVPVGAEAGMFRPKKERRLELGKMYIHQVPTEMLMQNNAFKMFSKTTTSFIDEYIKKQTELRRQQKAALSVYEKRGRISGQAAIQIELLTDSLVKLSNVAIQCARINTELHKALDQLEVSSRKQIAVQEFRSENVRHLTGPLTGLPMLRTPKIDIRRVSELSPHERLFAASIKYRKTVEEHGELMDEYNVSVKKGELASKALADIEYVKDLAKERPGKLEDMEKLAEKISTTGDLASASTLMELEKQTNLEQQTVDNLSTIIGLIGSGGTSAGVEILRKAGESEGINREILLRSARTTVGSEIGLLAQSGDFSKITEYMKSLKDTGTIESPTGKIDYGKIFSADAFTKLTSAFPTVIKEALVASGALEEFAKLGPEATKEERRTASEEQYRIAAEQGAVGQLFNIPGVIDKVLEYLGGLKEAPSGDMEKSTEKLLDNIYAMKEPAKQVEGEIIGKTIEFLEGVKKELKAVEEEMAPYTKYLEKNQKALRNFNKVSGGLEKAVASLTDTFRDLERQSIVNQKLIKLRAEYLSTRGGPMRRTAPSVNIDVATTAGQYSPHQALYERSTQYKKTTDEYLAMAEAVKEARSKMEAIETIRGKAEFMETQGINKEEINKFVESALKTGSVESALIVTEISKLVKIASNIDAKTPKLAGVGKEGGIGLGVQKIPTSLEDMFEQAKAANKAAEAQNIEQANYMRGAQLRQRTRVDVAAGRGMSLDQITREENVWRATIGRVPSEIKERNRKLLQVYEAEKEARATFELEKRKILEPLQQSVSGMKSIIDSIKTGLSGIMGGRNIRPLDIDFTEWSKRQGTSEMAQERVAEQSAQFNLAKSLYSQNLSLRAQGVETGVRPRELYDIMEKASRGEDITGRGGPFAKFIGGGGGPLQAIQERLSKAMEAKEEKIREIQAEEYATAVRGAMGPSENKLDSIKDNTGKLISSGESVGNSIVDAVNALRDAGLTVNIPGLKISGTGGDVGVSYAKPSELERQQKATEILGATGADFSFPQKVITGKGGDVGVGYKESELAERQRKARESFEKGGATVLFPTDAPSKEDIVKQQGGGFGLTMKDYIMSSLYQAYDKKFYKDMMSEIPEKEGVSSILEIDKGATDRKKDIEKLAIRPERKALTDSKKNVEVKQTESLLKTNKELSSEVSNLKDEVEVLKSTVSDVNKVFKEFSNNLEDVSSIGEASKDSALLIEDLGQSASDASTSLDTLSTKMSTFDVSERESGPTAQGEGEFEYISEEDAMTMINNVKEELSESIEQLSGDSETVESLVENVRVLSEDVEAIKTNIPVAPEGATNVDDFNAFKNEVSSYFETVDELKELIDDLDTGVTKNTASVLGLESGFELINKKLQDHDNNIVELQRNLGTIDAKFSEAISTLREEVAEAKDLAWSARVFATQK